MPSSTTRRGRSSRPERDVRLEQRPDLLDAEVAGRHDVERMLVVEVRVADPHDAVADELGHDRHRCRVANRPVASGRPRPDRRTAPSGPRRHPWQAAPLQYRERLQPRRELLLDDGVRGVAVTVHELVGIRAEVVELALTRVVLEVRVARRAQSLVRGVRASRLQDDRPVGGRRPPRRAAPGPTTGRPSPAAVWRRRGRGSSARGRCSRRARHGVTPLGMPGPRIDERDPDRRLVEEHLARGDPVLAEEEAVVGREHHDQCGRARRSAAASS